MKAIHITLLTALFCMVPFMSQEQNILQVNGKEKIRSDSTIAVENPNYYKTAEIVYEIENVKRYIRTSSKKIQSYQDISAIDSSFSRLTEHIDKEFQEFSTFNKLNLSKFYLLNSRRVWLGYKLQLFTWQGVISKRIQDLMDVSERIKERENLWIATYDQPGNKRLPEEINNKILSSINQLDTLETNLFELVGKLSVLDSRITDQIITVDQHIEIVEDLHKNYRVNILKATQPAIWNIRPKGSYDGTVGSRLHKAWYENTKSLKDSIPSFTEYFDKFIIRSLFLLLIIIGFRYFYSKQNPSKRSNDNKNIKELIIWHPGVSIIYMILFVFILLFSNIPLAFWGVVSLVLLIITYLLLRSYIVAQGRRVIWTFIVLLSANILEIVFWYFGSYARIYLLLEAGLGIILVSHFIQRNYRKEVMSKFRYKLIVDLLRYPFFTMYVLAFTVNLFGFQNLTVLLLKIGTQISTSIIIIIGAWEISRSILNILIELFSRYKDHKSHKYFPLIIKRLTLLLNLFFALVWFHTFLTIVEMDTPFYEGLNNILSVERHVGSLIFTYAAFFQFMLVMLITWGMTTVIKIIFSDDHFKRSQKMRGVPAAISMTLRLIIAMAGFFIALSAAGVDLTKISIMVGAFGVGIGFGLQNIVNNFISGLILIYERPIQAGDTIEINNLMGEVKSIGIRSSRVRTFDGAEVVVPNSILVSDQLINWTLSDDKRRIEIIVGVRYGTDPEKVIQILKQVAKNHELVSKEPEPRVLFNEFADSSLNFRLLCWVLFEHGIQTKSDLSVAIDKAFKENNVEIPYPQLDLHVVDTPVVNESPNELKKDQEDSKPLIAEGSGSNDQGDEPDEGK